MKNTNEYEGFFAEFYDILHANQKDVNAYIEFSNQYGKEVLELGSGTGRIMIPLAQNGCKITGLELNDDMIEIFREKSKQLNIRKNIQLFKGDMTQFCLDKKFDLIIAPCNLTNHLINEDDFKKMLNCVRNHLKEDGVFIIDNSTPDISTMVHTNGIEEKFEFINPKNGNKIIDNFKAEYDFVNQLEYNHILLEEYSDKKLVRKAESKGTMTYFFPREIRNYLKVNDFEIIEERGSLFERGEIKPTSSNMVFISKKTKNNNSA